MEIPGPVDLAVVTIPAAKVRDLIPQFQEKKIRNMLLITSGFAETGADGRRMEEELVREARGAGILILGPNTMGICNPYATLFCCGSNVRPKPGTTTILSQSGNLGVQLLDFAEHEGVGIRAFGGSGNSSFDRSASQRGQASRGGSSGFSGGGGGGSRGGGGGGSRGGGGGGRGGGRR